MISVIIPAWGEVPYLGRARASVPSDVDVETIVVAPPQDGPQTALAARLEGVRRAHGEWIAFLDADDCLAEGALAKLLLAAKANADIVCGGLVRVDRRGRRVKRPYSDIGPCDSHNTLCAKLIRRRLFEDVEVDLTIRNGEDLLVVEELLAAAKEVVRLDEIVYEYIENVASVTHRQTNEEKAIDLLKVDRILMRVIGQERLGAMHNRILRDALLLLVRAGKIGGEAWIEGRRRLTEPISSDIRHGFVKRTALRLACALEWLCRWTRR